MILILHLKCCSGKGGKLIPLTHFDSKHVCVHKDIHIWMGMWHEIYVSFVGGAGRVMYVISKLKIPT
jgi:hypothetical protein